MDNSKLINLINTARSAYGTCIDANGSTYVLLEQPSLGYTISDDNLYADRIAARAILSNAVVDEIGDVETYMVYWTSLPCVFAHPDYFEVSLIQELDLLVDRFRETYELDCGEELPWAR